MRQKSYGGLVVILFVCILALICGAAAGMLHIGQEFSEELIPISVSTPVDKISTIDEHDFVANNITVKYATQQTVKKNTTNTTTRNYTSNKTSNNNNTKKNTNKGNNSSSSN